MVNKVNGNNYYTYNRQKNINVSDTGEQFSLDYRQRPLQPQNGQRKKETDEEDGVRLELSGTSQSASKTDSPVKAAPRSDKAAGAAQAADVRGQTSLFESLRAAASSFFAAIGRFFQMLWREPDTATTDVDAAASSSEQEASDTDTVEAEQAADDDTGLIATAADDAGPIPTAADDDGPIPTAADDASLIATATDDAYTAADADSLIPAATDDAADTPDAYLMTRERLEEEIRPYLHTKDMQQVLKLLTDNGRRTVAKNSSLLTYYDKKGRITQPTASDRERILYGDQNARNL